MASLSRSRWEGESSLRGEPGLREVQQRRTWGRYLGGCGKTHVSETQDPIHASVRLSSHHKRSKSNAESKTEGESKDESNLG